MGPRRGICTRATWTSSPTAASSSAARSNRSRERSATRCCSACWADGPRTYCACVDIKVDVVEPSLTAVVVVEPMDLSRFMACFDAVYAFLRGDTDVRQTGQNVALYEHGPRMSVGVEVDRTFPPAGLVVSSQLPGGRIAHATHTTGYGDLHVTYDAVSKWCKDNDLRTVGT